MMIRRESYVFLWVREVGESLWVRGASVDFRCSDLQRQGGTLNVVLSRLWHMFVVTLTMTVSCTWALDIQSLRGFFGEGHCQLSGGRRVLRR
jgi:hypothetical protein